MLKPGFRIVPVIVGVCEKATIMEAARMLKPLIDEKTLVVASSDFTHYGKDYGYVPFVHDVRESLKALDMGAFHFIERKSPEEFRLYLEKTGATICGAQPIELLLRLLPESAECELQSYYVSGDITGDFSQFGQLCRSVVHRLLESAGERGGIRGGTHGKRQASSAGAGSGDDCAEIRSVASASGPFETDECGSEKRGAFVTLNIDGRLRGCIGEILPLRPLVKAVAGRALDAAFHDPRFYPLHEEELGRVTIEISALTPPHPVNSWRDIEIGRHGILLRKGDAGAVFLPQVAPEQGWDWRRRWCIFP